MNEERGEFDFGTFEDGWEAGVKRGRDYAKSEQEAERRKWEMRNVSVTQRESDASVTAVVGGIEYTFSAPKPVAHAMWEANFQAGIRKAKEADVSEITRGIIADLTARDLKGQREYGTTMDRADLTPLEWLDHEYAEILDAAQYNRAARRRVAVMEWMIDDLRDEVRRLKGEEVAG